jgi:hypothetical protein
MPDMVPIMKRSLTKSELHSAYPIEHLLVFVASMTLTVIGVVYAVVLIVSAFAQGFTFPPSNWLQTFGGITSLVECPILVILVAGLWASNNSDRKVFGSISMSFTVLFAGCVSINRFSQLGVVRLSSGVIHAPGIEWFQAYGNQSIMLGLEYLGWGWFLGIACLLAAPMIQGSFRKVWIRWLLVTYGLLAITSSIGFMLGNFLSLLGFFAWGFVLVAITLLMAIEYIPRRRS